MHGLQIPHVCFPCYVCTCICISDGSPVVLLLQGVHCAVSWTLPLMPSLQATMTSNNMYVVFSALLVRLENWWQRYSRPAFLDDPVSPQQSSFLKKVLLIKAEFLSDTCTARCWHSGLLPLKSVCEDPNYPLFSLPDGTQSAAFHPLLHTWWLSPARAHLPHRSPSIPASGRVISHSMQPSTHAATSSLTSSVLDQGLWCAKGCWSSKSYRACLCLVVQPLVIPTLCHIRFLSPFSPCFTNYWTNATSVSASSVCCAHLCLH